MTRLVEPRDAGVLLAAAPVGAKAYMIRAGDRLLRDCSDVLRRPVHSSVGLSQRGRPTADSCGACFGQVPAVCGARPAGDRQRKIDSGSKAA